METRIEIFRDGVWKKLRLQGGKSVYYNALINKIGKIESREISHTNTFSLPQVHQNIQALGLNFFNSKELAVALNSKYIAKYYVDDKLLQQGFLVINNTIGGTIQVNFIDAGLDITEKWGSITYNELILGPSGTTIPADLQASIDEMTDYDMDKTSVLVPLTNIGARGYNLALFPNNLNVIGDLFQLDDSEVRVLDQFNPYQSRPIFNVKAFMDIAVEAFGYTPIYDASVDWDAVADLYINDKGLNENQRDDGGIQSITQPIGHVTFEYWNEYTIPNYNVITTVNWGFGSDMTTPSTIPNWTDPPNFKADTDPGSQPGGYLYQNCIYIPRIDESTLGIMTFGFDVGYGSGGPTSGWNVRCYAIWEHATPGTDVIFEDLTFQAEYNDTVDSISRFDCIITKTIFDTPPASSNGNLIGIIMQRESDQQDSGQQVILEVEMTETYIPSGVISYDEFGQYGSNTISLTHAAPRESVKSLLANIMQQQGILMNIDGIAKEIKFFSYGKYQTQKEGGTSLNWNKYLQKYNPFLYNTDYGNDYAKQNKISLSNPYVGNVYVLSLNNQGEDSKYKDSTEAQIKLFKDVSNITKIGNTTPHFEYENLGLGMVEYTGVLGSLTQARADGTTQGAFSNLPAIGNVNYAGIPNGVQEWYNLIDEAVRAEASFLLPVQEIKDLDLSIPIYSEELGGFWIIEEIAEYSNAQTIVTVKLIKLIDNLITV